MERSNTSPVTVEQWDFINSTVIHKGRIHEVVDDPWFQNFPNNFTRFGGSIEAMK